MIKIDTDRMEDAYARFCVIQNRIAQIEDEVVRARARLRSCMEDGGAVTDAMMFSLNMQAKSIGKRKESAAELARVLGSVTEQYRKCETDAKPLPLGFVSVIKSRDIIKPVPPARPDFVKPAIALETIVQYISPLITTGEDTV